MITQAELQKILHYDPETGLFTWLVDRLRAKRGQRADKIDQQGYYGIWLSNRMIKAHRLAWLYMTGAWPTQDIDHINGIRHDNRWSNLRICNKSENGQNRKKSSNNTSGHPGVYWMAGRARWRVIITSKNKRMLVGDFQTIEEAVEARKKAKTEYHKFNPVDRV